MKVKKQQTANCMSRRQHRRCRWSGTESAGQNVMVDILNINFKPMTFCCMHLFVLTILVSVNLIGINKCEMIAWNVLLLCMHVWEYYTVQYVATKRTQRYGMNFLSNQIKIKFIEQQRARGASYRLLNIRYGTYKTNKHYMHTRLISSSISIY